MNHEEIKELLGAFALDAVEPEESFLIESHIEHCLSCAIEVADYKEVAAKLGSTTSNSSTAVWDAIERSLDFDISTDDVDSVLKVPALKFLTSNESGTSSSHPPRSSLRWRRTSAAIGTIAAAVIVVLGFEVSHLSGQLTILKGDVGTPSIAAVADAALSNSSARVLTLKSNQGVLLAEVAILPNGQSYFLGKSLSAVTGSKTYQLWGISSGRVVSLGILGSNPKVISFVVQGNVSQLMLNIEPEGGVTLPTSPVIATAKIV